MRSAPSLLRVLTHRQASEAGTINSDWLLITLTISAHYKAHKDQVQHIPNTNKGKTEVFLPHGVETVALD